MPIDKLFDTISNSSTAKGAIGGVAGGSLATLLLHKKSRKKLGKAAVQLGGAAAIAGVGYYAFNKWQQNKASPTPADPQTSDPPAQAPQSNVAAAYAKHAVNLQADPPQITDSFALKLIKAMISAAAADGEIDSQEMSGLMRAIEMAGLTPDENAELTRSLNHPPTVEEVAALAGAEEEAAEIYGAALNAIDPDTPAEMFYLKRLASALSLDPGLVSMLHETEQALPG